MINTTKHLAAVVFNFLRNVFLENAVNVHVKLTVHQSNLKPSSIVAPQTELHVQPFGVVVSGSGPSFTSFAFSDSDAFPVKGHSARKIANIYNGFCA